MKAVKDRLVVVSSLYHQQGIEQPTLIESTFSRDLEGTEQLFQRQITVGEGWIPLDRGWIEEAGMLHIANNEGRNQTVNPSDDERAELAQRIVELAYSIKPDESWLILPRESMRAMPSSLENLWIRCRHGKAHVTITLIPR